VIKIYQVIVVNNAVFAKSDLFHDKTNANWPAQSSFA
jgi:hypothetical protein